MISPAREMPSTEHDVEFRSTERRSYLVLHNFHFGLLADYFIAVLDGLASTDVKTYGGIELQCINTAGSCSGIAEHDTDFSRNWLMKIQVVRVLLTAAVSLRKACDMSRACRPTGCHHIAFNFSFRG